MNLGYFSHTNFSVSETFIYDLVNDLSKVRDINLIYYSGRRRGKIDNDFNLNYKLTGYSDTGETLSYLVYKIGQVFGSGRGFRWKSFTQRKLANYSVNKNVRLKLDLAYVDYANSAVLLREYFEENNIPYVVHVHGYDITSSVNDPAYLEQLGYVFNSAKYLIAASDYMRRLLLLLGAKDEKIRVIRYGIDVKSITPMDWQSRLKFKPSVIFLGRLTAKKHPIALLYAFNLVLLSIPDAILTIIGDGPLMPELKKRILDLNIKDSVFLLGSLKRTDSFPILNKHWVYAQHSVTAPNGDQEGYAISPAEAAAHELPVVSTIHNGINEHVQDGITGYLVPEFDFEKMAERIIHLLRNPQLAERMGKAGRINIQLMNNRESRLSQIIALLLQ
ncbi:MAG: glycosyltransferase family 4 protein [Bacteroidia bacterium]|nr:glycosyltransferase family 4 protein [Bacteroidia bacterium]